MALVYAIFWIFGALVAEPTAISGPLQYGTLQYPQKRPPVGSEYKYEPLGEAVKQRSQDFPSAERLNELLRKIQSDPRWLKSSSGTTPLDVAVLLRLNLARVKDGACLTLLRQGDTLRWPRTLQQRRFETERKEIEALWSQAIKQVRAGKVQGKLLDDLDRSRERLQRSLNEAVDDLRASEYIEAKRFLSWVKGSATTHRDPQVRDIFTAIEVLPAKAKTIGALVRYLTENGWQFADFLDDSRDAYLRVHQAMQEYVKQLK